jgi:hypothetical protein
MRERENIIYSPNVRSALPSQYLNAPADSAILIAVIHDKVLAHRTLIGAALTVNRCHKPFAIKKERSHMPALAFIATTPQKQIPWVRLTIALFIMLLLGACATTADLMDNLNKSLRGYEKAIRWGQYEAAYSFHKWEAGAPPALPKNIENFRVTKYETFGEKFNEKDMIMKQTVKLRYYNTETQREKSLQLPQEWEFDPKSKRWFLISPPIAFQ